MDKKILIRRRCSCGCEQTTNYGKKYICGHNEKCFSEETRFRMSLSSFKSHPNGEYCEEWYDREYKKDLRKDYCENVDCRGTYTELNNHHINLNKKDCRPENVMTLCVPCHTTLHNMLKQVKNKHNILTINKQKYIRYIHKKTRQVITMIERILKDE